MKMPTHTRFTGNGADLRDSTACPVVVRPQHDSNCFELRSDKLSSLLTNSDIADLPVVVLSVAGGFRLGKSFLLGFCIRYLKHLGMSSDPSDWMDEDNIPLTGFSWRYGSERETTGIQLWGKVFKVKTRKYGLVAVVLMDTEGSFDNRSTMEGNVTIFAMSMLLSSIQVYNLTKHITQCNLEHLELFAEYASMAKSAGGKNKEVFQKLLFLIRDWQYPGEKPFGLEGGRALLHPFLQRDPTLPREVSDLREKIRTSYSEMACFLMPRPGDAVENKRFDGRLRDISQDFKHHLKKLVPYLLSPERLVPKMINGRIVTCKELVCMFHAYFNVFKGKQLPAPMTVFNATAYVNNQLVIEEIVNYYETEMEKIAWMDEFPECDTNIKNEHDTLMMECLSMFENETTLGSHDTELREQLVKELTARYDMRQRTRKLLRELNEEMEHRIRIDREEAQRLYEEEAQRVIEEENARNREEMAAMEERQRREMEQIQRSQPRDDDDDDDGICVIL